MIRWSAVALCLLFANGVFAIPPNRIVHLKPGESRFEPGPQGHWRTEALDPSIVSAKAFETKEVFLTGKKQGQTLLLLSNQSLGEILFWQVVVGDEPEPRKDLDPSTIDKHCKCDLDAMPISCKVPDRQCIQSLKQWMETNQLRADDIRLVYTAQSLQEVLKEIEKGLADSGIKGVSLSFFGVNLKIQGKLADRAQWRKLMQIIYKSMVGKLLMYDQTSIADESERTEPIR